ncbi:MAG: GNAT family N-acetyltransferase [Acidimicrobiia bacterium]
MRRALPSRPRHTPRLTLYPFRRRDADAIVEAVRASLPEFRAWLPWARSGYSKSDAARFIRDSIAAWNEGRAFDFAIHRPQDPECHLGNISVWFTSRRELTGEVGYWIRTDESGAGICTEAAARMLEVAFDELGLHRVVLRIGAGNRASERVAEKLGFIQEGILRQEVKVNGAWMDHSLWGLIEDEYREATRRYAEAGWIRATRNP